MPERIARLHGHGSQGRRLRERAIRNVVRRGNRGFRCLALRRTRCALLSFGGRLDQHRLEVGGQLFLPLDRRFEGLNPGLAALGFRGLFTQPSEFHQLALHLLAGLHDALAFIAGFRQFVPLEIHHMLRVGDPALAFA